MNTVPIRPSLCLGIAGPGLSLDQRFCHVLVLVVTGYLIGQPPAIQSASEASWQLLVWHRAFLPLRRRICVLLQLRFPHLLGLRREPLCELE